MSLHTNFKNVRRMSRITDNKHDNFADVDKITKDLQLYYANVKFATVLQMTEHRLKSKKQINLGYIVETFDFPVYPDGYCPFTTPGDGLCFIHSLIRSVIMFWYSIGDVAQVNIWKTEFITFMIETLHLSPICNIDIISFDNPLDNNLDVENVLLTNELFFNVLVYNIMHILTTIWTDPNFHQIPNEQFKYGIPNVTYVFGMHRGKVTAIDGLARNLVMGIVGVNRVEIIQPYTHTHSGEDVRRVTTLAQQQVIRVIDDTYRGCIIDKKDIPCLFGARELSVMMYSRNSRHYDLFLSIRSHQVAVPVCFVNDVLPQCTQMITSTDVPCDPVLVH